MKVLFLTKYPRSGASSRYRVYQYLPSFEAMGLQCTVSSFMNETMYDLTFSAAGRVRKLLHLLRACWRRLRVLRHWRDYDVIVMQRELFPLGPPWVERYLHRRGACLVFDYDDALFIHKPGKFNPGAARLRNSHRVFEIFSLVDCVVAGNEYLRSCAAEYCSDCQVVHVAEDSTRFSERDYHRDVVTIGWLGSPTTEKYLGQIAPVLRSILLDYPQARLKVIGGGDFTVADCSVEHQSWSLESEEEGLQSFDIGIMPLPQEDWSLGKSGGKARTYMASGLPAVCTAIGYNCELIDDGKTGLLVESLGDWECALRDLIEQPQLRETLGKAARSHINEHFSVAGQAGKLASVLQRVSGAAESHGV